MLKVWFEVVHANFFENTKRQKRSGVEKGKKIENNFLFKKIFG